MNMDDHHNCAGDAPALLAIVRAARAIGDRELEWSARHDLEDRFGIKLVFRKPSTSDSSKFLHHAALRAACALADDPAYEPPDDPVFFGTIDMSPFETVHVHQS